MQGKQTKKSVHQLWFEFSDISVRIHCQMFNKNVCKTNPHRIRFLRPSSHNFCMQPRLLFVPPSIQHTYDVSMSLMPFKASQTKNVWNCEKKSSILDLLRFNRDKIEKFSLLHRYWFPSIFIFSSIQVRTFLIGKNRKTLKSSRKIDYFTALDNLNPFNSVVSESNYINVIFMKTPKEMKWKRDKWILFQSLGETCRTQTMYTQSLVIYCDFLVDFHTSLISIGRI